MSPRRRRGIATTAAIAVVVAAVLGFAGYRLKFRLDTITLTAQFDSAAGLYENNMVAVLGMPVGKVTRITPKGGYVEVDFTVANDVKVPADASAVTVATSILTDRQIELTPPYRGGPALGNHDTIGLARTKTPVAFDRLLDMLDKISNSLSGDNDGAGPVADLIDAGADSVAGNGEQIKSALGELSRSLRLSADNGEVTRGQLTTIIADLSSLVEAADRNDAKLRQFGSTTRQLSQVLSEEDFGAGTTGHKLNEIVNQLQSLVDNNRGNLKAAVANGDIAAQTIVENQRETAELLDLLPLALENIYNTVDQENGSIRGHLLVDKTIFDSQFSKEICNLMHLRQLGCSTGTLQDYGPDFGLTYILDGLSMMGQ